MKIIGVGTRGCSDGEYMRRGFEINLFEESISEKNLLDIFHGVTSW